jgi:vitamin B12 transporter
MLDLILATAAAAQGPVLTEEKEVIIVTGSREPVEAEDSGVSATVFTHREIEALGLPHASDILRLVPGVSIAAAGPKGSQTQLRIRGAEANHTLLFIDGIRFNDPAAGNEGRFELLTNDTLSRVEVVRGPQSALWGSEALGGVVAVETADPLRTRGIGALVEYGSLDSRRFSADFVLQTGNLGLAASGGWLRSDGIDSFGAAGERDGFDNKSASLKAIYGLSGNSRMGLSGLWTKGWSEFDGYDAQSFVRADTLDQTFNRIHAGRGWFEGEIGSWSLVASASLLESANRNRLGDEPLNSTYGRRWTMGAQASRSFGVHRLTAAVEHENERFKAKDQQYFGATDQNRSRTLNAFVGQWRADWTGFLTTDIAVRHDSFSAFDDARTVRAAVLIRPSEGLTLHASYGEGIAQPSFYDLYGFFPALFSGNPELRPERSRGYETGISWADTRSALGLTFFTNDLRDEIIDVFDPVNFLSSTANAEGKSRRRGFEFNALHRIHNSASLRLNYTFLDAEEQQAAAGLLLKEVRRPRHSANLLAHGTSSAFNWGASLAYVGRREDMDFDVWPAARILLDDYLLASLKLGWRLTPGLEAYARAENLFDADYQDAVGYHTPGRTVYAGIRLRLGR